MKAFHHLSIVVVFFVLLGARDGAATVVPRAGDQADLSVSLIADKDVGSVGWPASIESKVKNNGPSDLARGETEIVVTLSRSARSITIEPDPIIASPCKGAGTTLTCRPAIFLPAADSWSPRIQIVMETPGKVSVTESVSSPLSDPVPADNVGTVAITIGVAPPPVTIELDKFLASPRQPRAGKRFVVSGSFSRWQNGQQLGMRGGKTFCSAAIRKRKLPLAERRFVRQGKSGRATCAWVIPRGTAGELLAGSLGVTVGGKRGSGLLAFRVR